MPQMCAYYLGDWVQFTLVVTTNVYSSTVKWKSLAVHSKKLEFFLVLDLMGLVQCLYIVTI